MDLALSDRRKLPPMLMEWVNKSRIKEHLPDNCYFIMLLGNTLEFHLSHLSEGYQNKHIIPDIQSYSLSLYNHLLPIIKQWCMICNLNNIELQLRFRCGQHRYSTSRTLFIKKDDKEYREYLANKST